MLRSAVGIVGRDIEVLIAVGDHGPLFRAAQIGGGQPGDALRSALDGDGAGELLVCDADRGERILLEDGGIDDPPALFEFGSLPVTNCVDMEARIAVRDLRACGGVAVVFGCDRLDEPGRALHFALSAGFLVGDRNDALLRGLKCPGGVDGPAGDVFRVPVLKIGSHRKARILFVQDDTGFGLSAIRCRDMVHGPARRVHGEHYDENSRHSDHNSGCKENKPAMLLPKY